MRHLRPVALLFALSLAALHAQTGGQIAGEEQRLLHARGVSLLVDDQRLRVAEPLQRLVVLDDGGLVHLPALEAVAEEHEVLRLAILELPRVGGLQASEIKGEDGLR